jgi:salicylate hydroxylase
MQVSGLRAHHNTTQYYSAITILDKSLITITPHHTRDSAISSIKIVLKMSETAVEEKPLDVAIVGGGITGVTLALGLLHRGIKFKIYERADSLREIGAGIAFTPNAERAMQKLDPRIHQAFRKVATPNIEDYFVWVDGYHYNRSDPDNTNEELVSKLYVGERGFEGCRRQDFIEELVKHIPKEDVKYGKNLASVTDRGDGEKIVLGFRDGTTEEADVGKHNGYSPPTNRFINLGAHIVVIGCDGIRSKLRRLMFGEDNPASRPSYTHKFAFRSLVPTNKARELLGDYKVATRLIHVGPNAHAITFPVAMGALINLVAFVTDPKDWAAEDGKFTARTNKSEAVEYFAAFGPAVRAIMSLLPDELDKWALFDQRDHPVPTYVRGRLCLAGDAAHASSPHHGAGAGSGVEDALVLAELIGTISEAVARGTCTGSRRAAMVRAALETYNAVRYERTQWIVDSSRVAGEMFEWQHASCGSDPEKFDREIAWRSHKIWDYDVDEMVCNAHSQFSSSLEA